MEENTQLTNLIEAQLSAKYDTEVKNILADKNILSWILKYSVHEFSDYAIKDIYECIEGEILVSRVPLDAGVTNTTVISGMNTEDTVPGEGKVTFDIRFHVLTKEERWIKLIINVEAQNEFYPGYHLDSRAVFYCARMISAQKHREFEKDEYDKIKKVYSIWLCFSTPKEYSDTITRYHIQPEDLCGRYTGPSRYDLMEFVIVRLGKESEENKHPLIKLMHTVVLSKMTAKEKLRTLEEDFGILPTIKMKERIESMCNVSQSIWSQAIKEGIEQGREMGRELGIEQGRKQGIEQLANLIQWLQDQKRIDEALKVAADPVLRDKLFEEMAMSKAN